RAAWRLRARAPAGAPARESATTPYRRALLGERSGPLTGVLRAHHRFNNLALTGEELGVRPVGCLGQDALCRGQGEWPIGGDRLRQRQRDRDRVARLGQAVNHPELISALGVDRFAGQRQLHRNAAWKYARETQQRAGGSDE